MIVSVFVRRPKEGRAFAEFIEEWEADEGFGVPTRVFIPAHSRTQVTPRARMAW